MFEIYGGHEKFTQWTKDQKLIMDRLPLGAEILFYNDPTVDDPLITEVHDMVDENGKTIKVCNVPNILLTESKKIKVRIPDLIVGRYGVHHKYVGIKERYFEVKAAEKPADYVYEETELNNGLAGNGSTSGGISDGDVATDAEVDDILNDIFGV